MLRKSRGWKRSRLAKESGLSYQHIYGIEAGFNPVSVETLQLIANVLDVDINVIRAAKDDKKGADKVGDSTGPGRRQDKEKSKGPKRVTDQAVA